jgi:uncharacterized membrane protein
VITARTDQDSNIAAATALLALAGCGISTYLALCQMHRVGQPWDPVFGGGSAERVLMSRLSQALPVPDAAVGAVAYGAEVALALWLLRRDSDRAERALALISGGMGAGSAGLVALQALVVHSWCSLCLCSAVISGLNAWLNRRAIIRLIR